MMNKWILVISTIDDSYTVGVYESEKETIEQMHKAMHAVPICSSYIHDPDDNSYHFTTDKLDGWFHYYSITDCVMSEVDQLSCLFIGEPNEY